MLEFGSCPLSHASVSSSIAIRDLKLFYRTRQRILSTNSCIKYTASPTSSSKSCSASSGVRIAPSPSHSSIMIYIGGFLTCVLHSLRPAMATRFACRLRARRATARAVHAPLNSLARQDQLRRAARAQVSILCHQATCNTRSSPGCHNHLRG